MPANDIYPNSIFTYQSGYEIDCSCEQYEQVQNVGGEGSATQELLAVLNQVLAELETQTEILNGG